VPGSSRISPVLRARRPRRYLRPQQTRLLTAATALKKCQVRINRKLTEPSARGFKTPSTQLLSVFCKLWPRGGRTFPHRCYQSEIAQPRILIFLIKRDAVLASAEELSGPR